MIVLELPKPLSVNRIRRIDWRAYNRVTAWQAEADAMFLDQKRKLPPPITGPYEITITLRDGSRMDLDNCTKLTIDCCRRFQLVADDSPKYMRKVTIQFGKTDGCRVEIKPVEWTPDNPMPALQKAVVPRIKGKRSKTPTDA